MNPPSVPFSIRCGETLNDLEPQGQIPLTSHAALQSIIHLCNRHGVSICQVHTALAIAMLLPTHNYLQVDVELPHPEIYEGNAGEEIHRDDSNQLFNELPGCITLGCAVEVLNSSLCGIFWNPDISSDFVSPWLQPTWDLRMMDEVGSVSGRYAEVVALICAQRYSNASVRRTSGFKR